MKIAIDLRSPVEGRMEEFARENALGDVRMAAPDVFAGRTVALCGAGPSLRHFDPEGVDCVFATNSALGYLIDRGFRVTAGLGIDQTPGLLREWETTHDVVYYLGSTVDPALVAHLRDHDRDIRFFHNLTGFDGEWEHYCEEWPPGFMVATGATVVSRAVGLLFWMGFERVDVWGADCALAPDGAAHANGEDAGEAYGGAPVLMEGNIGGRKWVTRPDMLMDAVDLVRKVGKHDGKLRLIGDTLPASLLGKDDDYLDAVMRRLGPNERP